MSESPSGAAELSPLKDPSVRGIPPYFGMLVGFLVPALFFGILELACRMISVTGTNASDNSSLVLEMPTWMLQEENTRARAVRAAADPLALEWLTMFESAPRIRVRLIPGSSRDVVNTFARLPIDRAFRYRLEANSLGFRGPALPAEKSPGSLRVLVFGDSSSFGWGVNYEQTYSALLQDRLQEHHRGGPVEVGNFAIPGDSSEYGRLIFDEYAHRFAPDLVILGFGANDAKTSRVSHTDQVERFRSRRSLQSLVTLARKSALYRTLEELLAPPSIATTDQPTVLTPAVNKKRYQENLSEMITASRAMGAKNALVLTLCTPAQYARVAMRVAEHDGVIGVNGQAALLKALPTLGANSEYATDVTRLREFYGTALDQDPLLLISPDGCHPNQLGHRFIASLLSDAIIRAAPLSSVVR